MERIGLEGGARQPARRVADALETDDDDLAAEPMHLRQSRCISGRAAVLASSHVAGVGFGAGVGAGVFCWCCCWTLCLRFRKQMTMT